MPCVLDARHCHFDAKTLNGLTLQGAGLHERLKDNFGQGAELREG